MRKVVLLCMMMVTLTASAINKKELRQLQATIDSLNTIAEKGIKPPQILENDQTAKAYCQVIYQLSPEAYSKDTAQINATFRTWKWVMNNNLDLPDDVIKKVKNYDRDKLMLLHFNTHEALQKYSPRYNILLTFCNKVMQQRLEAKNRQMPTGKIVSLKFVERPTHIYTITYLLTSNNDGTWILRLEEGTSEKLQSKEVSLNESEVQNIRQLIEEGGIYCEPSPFLESPSFPDCPPKMGGSLGWSFSCDFEGGGIITSSTEIAPSIACKKVIQYIYSLVGEI